MAYRIANPSLATAKILPWALALSIPLRVRVDTFPSKGLYLGGSCTRAWTDLARERGRILHESVDGSCTRAWTDLARLIGGWALFSRLSFFLVVIWSFFSAASLHHCRAGVEYEMAVPYLSDDVLRRELRRGTVHRDVLIERDNVSRWIRRAWNRDLKTEQRVRAIERLHDYRQLRIKRCFVALLGDASMDVRESAAHGLGKLNFPSTIPILIDALRYCRGSGRKAVRESLKKLTGNDFGNDLKTWRLWYEKHRKEYR